MAVFEVDADVYDESTSTVTTWSPESALDFLSASRLRHPRPDGEPVKKRQRVSTNGPNVRHPSANDAAEDCVTLADVSLVLRTGPNHMHTQGSLGNAADVVPVILRNVRLGRHQASITLELAHHYAEIQLRLRSIKSEVREIFKHLLWTSNIQHASKVSHIAFSECTLALPSEASALYTLHFKTKWRSGFSSVPLSSVNGALLDNLLAAYIPAGSAVRTDWTPQDFYENVHVPSGDVDVPAVIQSELLTSQLYPFQKRAVDWLLSREGIRYDQEGNLCSTEHKAPLTQQGFRPTIDATGRQCYVSHLERELRTTLPSSPFELKGGILADEMGLGKTVELIALILLHRRAKETDLKIHDPYSDSMVVPSPATLIITPPTILEQWKSEFQVHAPELRILHYEGVKHSKLTDDALRELLLQQDVVITTYGVLANEIHYADEKPKRNLRQEKRYEPRRTPLVQISWWRVCLDEAQMVESGVSNAAKVARLIPRCNSWAVSGTPLRKDVKDLLGLLIFLRMEPFCSTTVWNRLISDYKEVFKEIIGQIAMRHTKSKVHEELQLPPQKRIVITVPFTAIEEQNYIHLFQQMCDECGLDREGAPVLETWNPESTLTVEKMRLWLTRLRQTCLHAEIGVQNRRALGRGNGPLRTVEEVLQVLIDQNETSLRAEERAVLTAKVTRGHLLSFGKDKKGALRLYLEGLRESTASVEECRQQLAQEQRKMEQGRITTKKETNEGSDTEDEATEEKTGRLNVCRQRVRAALEMQHICAFFAATAYFQIKESLSITDTEDVRIAELEKEESAAYDHAKAIRRELLAEVSQKSKQLIQEVSNVKAKSRVEFITIQNGENFRGIESRKIFESVEDLSQILNSQAKQLNELRAKLMDLLTVKLLDQDEDLEMTGEEYELSTKQQDEQYAYFEGLRAAHADRYAMVTGQINVLINHEMGQALHRAMHGERLDPELKGPAPELTISILATRAAQSRELKKLSVRMNLPQDTVMSIRGIIADLRSLVTALQWQEGGRSNRAAVEVAILEQELKRLQQIASEQTKALAAFEKELDLFRSTMNQRLEFYRQLQQISDTVAPLQEEETDDVDVVRTTREQGKETAHAEKLATFMTKRRFLDHLRTESSGTEEHQRICVICQNTFEIGVLTVCGHQYCKECIGLWWSSKGTCPTCKRQLKLRDFHEITYKPQALQAQEEQASTSSGDISPTLAKPSRASIYSDMAASTLDEIKSIDLRNRASYGTKIDTIARHLLWLRAHDPGSKSIIFSQYRDFLLVLGNALDTFRIGHTSIGSKGGIMRFREDPSAECFLMHAKADSSGLNLVNATHVFLCEPLINAAIELQAIARVHRIGQRRPTTVWMYLVSDTVEEAIYDISVSRRLAHMQRSTTTATVSTSRAHSRATTPGSGTTLAEKELDAANSLELQAAPLSRLLTAGQSGGEVVAKDDLWSCLFGKPRRAQRQLEGLAAQEVGRFLRAEAAETRMSEGNVDL